MGDRNYWLVLFTAETWDEFTKSGGDVMGFRQSRWSTVRKIQPGDYLLAYLTGVSRLIGVMEATSEAFEDSKPIWSADPFPCRIRVRPIETVALDTAIPILELRDRLSIFEGLRNPNIWQGAVRGSPTRWTTADGEAVVAAIRQAVDHPVTRPLDPRKLRRQPKVLSAKGLGEVTVPETDGLPSALLTPTQRVAEESDHTEIQWLLLKLGSDMGLHVWAARNDKGRQWNDQRFDSLPRFRKKLPVSFDEVTNRIIGNIDVLWLKDNSFEAAFEIESTTSIYSGLLRMSDLLSMQPNINIPLFLVAPDERRHKVVEEINRPTFQRLRPPLVEVCKFIPFSALRNEVAKVEHLVRYLRPDFLETISESCATA